MTPNEPKRATPEAQMLLRAAGSDWKTVELLLEHRDAPVSSVGFHAQQYLEKVMKAVLVSNAVIFHRTHDLEELADLLERRGIELPLPKAQLRRLNPFAVTIRYEDIELTLTDIDTVAEMMENAQAWVERQVYE
ncbi:MAG TPA: HEPN domain-containing protein [Chloroflexi bacterium]|nr:HEPN domain-containing protein [Chloroflexota bacterium]